MNFKIVADSSADFPEIKGVPFATVPFKIVTDVKEYVDDGTLDVDGMVADLLKYKGKSGTACAGPGEWMTLFGDAEYVFCVTISSNLSGSYSAATVAKEQYEAAHPGRKVYVVDSLSAGAEMYMIAEKLEELILAGKSFEEICTEIAEYTKSFGVKNFVFFSSMIVYGADKPLGTEFIIDETTDPNPENFYGKSKLDAEQELLKLQDNNFSVAILRIPMVYGPDCKGNFPQLLKVAKKSPFCPNIKNKRSMIYVDNLCEFLRLVIENNKSGIFYPQNSEYVSTVDIIKIAAKYFNHKIIFIRLFNPLIKLLSKRLGVNNKIFGTKFYDMSLSPDLEKYNIVDFETSIKECVLAFK